MRIKRLNEYESLRPGLGDWVLCEDIYKILNSFVSTHVGKVLEVDITLRANGVIWNFDYLVGYPDISLDDIDLRIRTDMNWAVEYGYKAKFLKLGFNYPNRPITFNEVRYWSKDREDVELYLKSKKFNL